MCGESEYAPLNLCHLNPGVLGWLANLAILVRRMTYSLFSRVDSVNYAGLPFFSPDFGNIASRDFARPAKQTSENCAHS